MYGKCIINLKKVKVKLEEVLGNDGISEDDIRKILYDDYKLIKSQADLINYCGSLSLFNEFNLEKLFSSSIQLSEDEENRLNCYLYENDLTYSKLYSIYLYVKNFKIFLMYREGVEKDEILSNILDELVTKLKALGYRYDEINSVTKFILNNSRSIDYFDLFNSVKEFCLDNNILEKDLYIIQKFVDNINCYRNIDIITHDLDSLVANKCDESVLLYKYMTMGDFTQKFGSLKNVENKIVSLNGYTRASTMYSLDVKKEVIFELYTPHIAEGIVLSPFMNFDNDLLLSGDFLLNLSNIFVFDVKEITIMNEKKNLIKALVLPSDVKTDLKENSGKVRILKQL